jgi:hypothetical protein
MPTEVDNRLATDVSWFNYLCNINRVARSHLNDFAWRSEMTDMFNDKPADKAPSNAILAKYLTKIADLTSPEKIEEMFIEELAKREAEKKTKAFAAVYENLTKLEIARVKVDRPDDVKYDRDRKITHQAWSAGRLDELKKLTDGIAKHEKALTEALTKNEWKFVYELAQQSAGKDKTEGSGKGGGTPPEAAT